jgi:hypothetical protein
LFQALKPKPIAAKSKSAGFRYPGGTYIPTQTNTYGIACINSDTAKPCNSASMPNNVVTATGAGANYNGGFVQCNPVFSPHESPSSPTSGAAASFEDDGTGYTSVDSTGHCVPMIPQPFYSSSCIVVACQTTTSGGGCPRVETCTDGDAWNTADCACEPASPIIVDVSGRGFDLTSAASGVRFDISGANTPLQMGWTAAGADNAFLALPGADGLVHNGKQLFGNFTPQPASSSPNGFAALAVYDDPKNGGNGNGMIDSGDGVFASLRLWIDENHDGISQPEELHTLPSLGVNSISLNYKADQRTDQNGNVFHYRAQVNPGDPTSTGRMAYDVFFVTLPSTSAKNLIPWRVTPANVKKCPAPPVQTKGGMLSTGSTLR